MEKRRIKAIIKSCRRFLISLSLIFISGFAFSQNLSLETIRQLRITPEEGQNLYTKSDIKFSVTIPGISPSQVQVLTTSQKQNINFRSIRKSEDYEQKGTKIDIWYNFDNAGTFTLTPISVMLKNSRRTIHFDQITVTDDPATLSPRIVIVFQDGTKIYSDETNYPVPLLSVKTGKKLSFTVNIQYAMQLVQFNWDIPKDSIFTCTKQFEFTEVKHRERVYSHTLIPVASFEWTGLVPGQQKLPKIRLNAAGYNGYRSELLLPEIIIEFTEGSSTETEENDSDIFASAFYQESSEADLIQPQPLSKEECFELSTLYSKEHNAFFNYAVARKNRINYETEHGLVVSASQIFPSVFLYIGILVIIASVICLIMAIRKKHKIRTLIFIVLLVIGTAVVNFCTVKRNERYGISAGCKIYSIPQESAESVSEVRSGSRVRILERTGKWYYIEVGETGGWCSAENIFIIR